MGFNGDRSRDDNKTESEMRPIRFIGNAIRCRL